MGFHFSSNVIFLWPLLNVDVLITHTNAQLSFGSHWIPAGHQPWLIISWVTAEYAQMLGVRTAWPSASAWQRSMHSAEVISQPPCSCVIVWNYKCIYWAGTVTSKVSGPLTALPVCLFPDLLLGSCRWSWTSHRIWELLFKHHQTVLEDCSGKSINLY